MPLTKGAAMTADRDLLRVAARQMLIGVLSCRENHSQKSGLSPGLPTRRSKPRSAAEHGDGGVFTYSCLVLRSALETVARAESATSHPREEDTRARMITRFKEGTFVYPGAFVPADTGGAGSRAEQPHRHSGWNWSGDRRRAVKAARTRPAPAFDNDDLGGCEAA